MMPARKTSRAAARLQAGTVGRIAGAYPISWRFGGTLATLFDPGIGTNRWSALTPTRLRSS